MGKQKFIDYAFKSYVLQNEQELLTSLKKSSAKDYAIDRLEVEGVYSPIVDDTSIFSFEALRCKYFAKGKFREFREAIKINTASYKRTARLKKRIGSMLNNGPCLFVTLTFFDSTLLGTTEKERRTLVTRYLGSLKCSYVANIDFGKENHREHYHAVVNISSIDLSIWREYGNINVERVRLNNKSSKVALSKYICKLTNHAIKETTKRSVLIYSRG